MIIYRNGEKKKRTGAYMRFGNRDAYKNMATTKTETLNPEPDIPTPEPPTPDETNNTMVYYSAGRVRMVDEDYHVTHDGDGKVTITGVTSVDAQNGTGKVIIGG